MVKNFFYYSYSDKTQKTNGKIISWIKSEKAEGNFMAVKSRSAAGLLLMAIVCLFSYCGYIFFETVVSICLVYVCVNALYGLCMYNFATDEALFRYEQSKAKKGPVSEEDAFFIKVKNVFLNILFIIYFSGIAVFDADFAFRIPAFFALLLWIFDFAKNNISLFKKNADTEWTLTDSALETVMWVQCILSVVIAVLKLMTL